MESSIKSSVPVNIFRPTIKEFQNFSKYIAELEKQSISFAKVSIFF